MDDQDRRCGNCCHVSPTYHCRHLGPLGGVYVARTGSPCAWHRAAGEERLAPPWQRLEPGESLHRMLRCNRPKDRPEREGWTYTAADETGVKPIQAPRHVRMLGYTGA